MHKIGFEPTNKVLIFDMIAVTLFIVYVYII